MPLNLFFFIYCSAPKSIFYFISFLDFIQGVGRPNGRRRVHVFPFSDVSAGNPFVFPLLNAPKYWGKISEAVCGKKSGKSGRTAL
jgi:hypothetical protein